MEIIKSVFKILGCIIGGMVFAVFAVALLEGGKISDQERCVARGGKVIDGPPFLWKCEKLN